MSSPQEARSFVTRLNTQHRQHRQPNHPPFRHWPIISFCRARDSLQVSSFDFGGVLCLRAVVSLWAFGRIFLLVARRASVTGESFALWWLAWPLLQVNLRLRTLLLVARRAFVTGESFAPWWLAWPLLQVNPS